MFKNKRYVTRGIAAAIFPQMQTLLWYLIDSMDGPEKDYLQVFQLEPDGEKQRVLHTQEEPPYRNEHLLKFGDVPVRVKIFVIDDGDHSTMLLAEEY